MTRPAPDLADYYRWLSLPPATLLADCRRTPFQASGPGGQKRNRVYSAVRLEHPPTGTRAESGAHREASRNVQDALHRLRLSLALAGAQRVALAPASDTTDPDPPPGYPVFRAKISPGHADFPAAVLRALSVFRAGGAEPRAAAEVLGISTSAFVRFLKLDKAVLAAANQARRTVDKPALL
jgi:hypothetical protein